MSPELERLLWARWGRDHAESSDRTAAEVEYRHLLEHACQGMPAELSRDQLLAAIDSRYLEFRRQRRRELVAKLPGMA